MKEDEQELLDMYAGLAMQAMLCDSDLKQAFKENTKLIATCAFDYAEAMIKERQKRRLACGAQD